MKTKMVSVTVWKFMVAQILSRLQLRSDLHGGGWQLLLSRGALQLLFNCLEDVDEDGVCDPLEIFGCTDEGFCNYNPEATEEDGTCGESNQVNDVCEGAFTLSCGQTMLGEQCTLLDGR